MNPLGCFLEARLEYSECLSTLLGPLAERTTFAPGINHFETAKYGCSELMMGVALRKLVPRRADYILQTKVNLTSTRVAQPSASHLRSIEHPWRR